MTGEHVINHPFGPADTQTPAYAAAINVTVKNRLTVLNIATLTGAATLNLTIASGLAVGSKLVVKAKSDGTARDLTPGTGMTGPVVAGVINKTKYQEYIYDGSTFVATAPPNQVD